MHLSPRSVLTVFAFAACLALAACPLDAGVLIARDGSAIRIHSHRVTATLENGLARTTVRQSFINRHGRVLEAVYLFPLPEGAALTGLTMTVAGQRFEGLLAERKKARRVYDAIVRRKRDPALVEQIGRHKFRLSVYPVAPDVETVIEITYLERVALRRGAFRYVYPLAIDGDAARTEHDFTFTLAVRSDAPLARVTANDGDARVARSGAGSATVSVERTRQALDRDLCVVATLRDERPTLSLRTYRDAKGDGYFTLLVTPPPVRDEDLVPRDVILVLDASGSMQGKKITQAKASALYLLKNLRAVDRVNVLAFSSDVRSFAERPVAATPENLARLRSFVSGIRAAGGTAIADAVRAAFAHAPAAGANRARTVVLLTDGQPTVGETASDAIIKLTKDGAQGRRLFTFGVGQDVDGALLDGMAAATRGHAELFRPGGEIETRLRRFLDRTSAPVLANLKLTAPGAYDVFPRPLPDVYLGEQVAIVGRYRDGGARTFDLEATAGDRAAHFTASGDLPREAGGSKAVADLFGRMKLDFLERQRRLRVGLTDEAYFAALDRGAYSTADEIVAEIIETSLAHGVQSAYTSFISLLPEDRHRIDPRDAAALQQAIDRKVGATRRFARSGEASDPAGAGGDPRPHAAVGSMADVEEEADEVVADQPYEGKQSNAAIGLGGGQSGAFTRRYGGAGTAEIVDDALAWLVAARVKDEGRFHAVDVGVGRSALALLAIVSAGHTHHKGTHKRVVREAIKYLRRVQQPDGRFGGPESDAVDHAMSTFALAEIYRHSRSPLVRSAVTRALPALLRNAVRPATDGATLVWTAMAMASARDGGIAVSSKDLTSFVARIDAAGTRPVGPPSSGAALDAAALFLRLFVLKTPANDPAIAPRIDALVNRLAPADGTAADATDTALWYFGSLAVFRAGGTQWRRVNRAMKSAIVATRRPDPNAPWRAVGPDAKRLGDVGTVALRAICCALYYR